MGGWTSRRIALKARPNELMLSAVGPDAPERLGSLCGELLRSGAYRGAQRASERFSLEIESEGVDASYTASIGELVESAGYVVEVTDVPTSETVTFTLWKPPAEPAG